MTIRLSENAEKLVAQKLASGGYASAEEVVLAGLLALPRGSRGDFDPGEMAELLAAGERSIGEEGLLPAERVFDELHEMSRQRRSGR